MKREFLKTLGVPDDQIDKIMDENGKDINDAKAKADAATTERDDLKAQLKQRDTDIADLKKSTGDKDEVSKKLTDLEAKYKTDTGELAAKLEKQAFDAKLDLALTGKVKNPKAVRALLDIDKIQLKDDALDGLEAQLTVLKTSDAYLFNDVGGKPAGKTPPAGGTGAGGQLNLHDAVAAKLSSQFTK